MSVLFYEGVDHMIEKITALIKGKANNSHKHTKSDITDFPSLGTASAKDVASSGNASTSQVVMGNDTRLSDSRKASDVSAWAKASTKPSYTKSEVGLGNVDNTSDTSKPVSTAQQTAIDTAYANANKYTDKKVADLIGSAPETMDTLEEVAAAIQKNKDVEKALNEAIGKKANQTELDTHTSNSTIHITASERTNWNTAKTHADSAHARTDATKVEKSTTNGNILIDGVESNVYTHPSGTNPHGTTKSDVGLGNVGNFKAVSTVASQGLTDTEKSNARANIGAQVAGSYASSTHNHDDKYQAKGSYASASHTHNLSTMINGLSIGTDTPSDADYYVSQYAGGGDTTTTYYRRPVSALWSYIKGKADKVYAAINHTHTKSQITDFPTSMPASDVADWAKASSKPSYTKSEVGLGNVDNTADANKVVKASTKLQTYKEDSTTETYGDNYPIYAQWRDASHVQMKCDNYTVETDYATNAGNANSAIKASGIADYNKTSNYIKVGYDGSGITGDEIKYIAGYTTGDSNSAARIKDVSKDALKSWLGLGSLAYSSATIPTIPSSLPANGGNSSTVNGHTVNSDVPANAKFTDTDTWRPQPDWDATSGDAMILNKPSIISAEPIEIESETSLNDVVDTGTYYCNYNKTYTNMPPSISNGWLCVSKVSDTIVKQVFLRHGTANTNDYQIYVRTKIGTTWSDWTKVVTSKDYATTSDYGAIKLSTSVSNTSTALAATPSAVKIAYDKAVSAFSGKGLPYAIFDIASDATTSAAWTETALQLKLQKSGAGDRVGSFRHGGSNFIYCPFSGIVDIDVNVFATAATNGYYYARCYKYNTSGDDELLDFAGLGGYTAAGCQGSGSMKVHVTAGTYIYINVAASTVIQASASNSHIRVQYTMID